MNPLTVEWVQKAEGDFISARRELCARRYPNFDSCCFHSQQCVEKYLKARLQEAALPFPRTHDLSDLLDLALPIEPAWRLVRADLRLLAVFAVHLHYPGQTASKQMAQDAFNRARSFRKLARSSLVLATAEP